MAISATVNFVFNNVISPIPVIGTPLNQLKYFYSENFSERMKLPTTNLQNYLSRVTTIQTTFIASVALLVIFGALHLPPTITLLAISPSLITLITSIYNSCLASSSVKANIPFQHTIEVAIYSLPVAGRGVYDLTRWLQKDFALTSNELHHIIPIACVALLALNGIVSTPLALTLISMRSVSLAGRVVNYLFEEKTK